MTPLERGGLDTERAVLGSILLAPESVSTALEILRPDDFVLIQHQLVFLAMAELARDAKPITTVAISAQLRAAQALEQVGMDVVVGLAADVATGANLAHYAGIVRARGRLRRLAQVATEIAQGANLADNAEEYIASSQSRLLAMTEDSRGDVIKAEEWAPRAHSRLEQRKTSGESPSLDCGIEALDRMRLLRSGSLITIAGRPGAGKTSLAQCVVLGAAARGAHVLFVSIEMGDEEIENKFIGAASGVPTRVLEWPKHIRDEDWPRITDCLRDLSEQAIDLWVASSVHIDDLRVRVRRVHAAKKLDLVVVDYLQLMRGERGDGRVVEVSSISRGLKVLAKEIDAPIIALSQLNRDCEKRDPPIPMLSDIRESGSIEQDSDAVVFVYRPVMYDDAANANEASAIGAKNRHGAPGEAKLFFEPQLQRFSDMEDHR